MKDEEKRALIKKYFPKAEWQRAWNVMQGESGGNPNAVGDNYPIKGIFAPSVGLFQIRTLPGRPSAEQLKNPEFNVKYAANMQSEQGWQPWTVAKKLGYTGEVKVAGYRTENMEEQDTTFKAKASAFRIKAKAKGWSSKKIEAFIDRKAEDVGVQTGTFQATDVTDDPSRLVEYEEEGVDIKVAPFEEGEVIDRTKGYLSEIGTYETKEEAMIDYEMYKPIMEKEGVDSQVVLDAINKKFPEGEEGEEEGDGFGALYTPSQKKGHEKIKSFFKKIFDMPTGEEKKQMWEKLFRKDKPVEDFFKRPVIFG